MKTIPFILAFSSVMFLSSVSAEKELTLNNLPEDTLIGVYDGHEDYGYNFIITDEDDEERMVTFQNAAESVSKKFDLSSETLIGKKFEVTYTSEMDIVKDDDGYEEEVELLTITALKPM